MTLCDNLVSRALLFRKPDAPVDTAKGRAALHVIALHSVLYLTETIFSLRYSAVSRVYYHGLVPQCEGPCWGSGPGAAAGSGRKDGCPTGGIGASGRHLPWR